MNPENISQIDISDSEVQEFSRSLRTRTYTYNPKVIPKKRTNNKKVKLQANVENQPVQQQASSHTSNPTNSTNANEVNENILNNSINSTEYNTADSSEEEIDISVLFKSPVKMASSQPKLTFDAAILTAAGVDPTKADQLNKFLQEQIIAATSNIKVTATTQSSIPAPQFDSDTMSALSYFTQLENYFNVQGMKSDNYHTAVGTILKGDKKIWYDNVAASITTWQEFKDQFSSRFDSIHIQERRRNLLYTRWQKEWEPVDTFVNEIVNLSKQCYPSEDNYMHVMRAKNRLYPFLREKITVEDETKLTINMLLEKAAYAIETQKAKDRITNRHSKLPPITGQKPQKHFTTRYSHTSYRGRGRGNRGTSSYGHHQAQHYRQNYTQNQPPQQNQSSNSQFSQQQSQQGLAPQDSQSRERSNSFPSYGNRYGRAYDKSNQKCHTCGQLGHFSFECGKFQGVSMAITGANAEPIQGTSSQAGFYGNRNLNYSRGRGNRGR